ncbi:InlB B-repeat-containing protein [Syntrophomonas palmitatica]|uniref:InlB B-repeat-containing protein n=1 Tax=Syntrophomonas palmitatica TaxID=402877 RepID=UPI00155DB3F4|nr:InlB B-repeat-containing protein [Syntrophomonas palmitatica]
MLAIMPVVMPPIAQAVTTISGSGDYTISESDAVYQIDGSYGGTISVGDAVYQPNNITITGSSSNAVQILIPDNRNTGLNLTLDNLSITDAGSGKNCIEIQTNQTVNLYIKGSCSINSTKGASIHVPAGKTLVIDKKDPADADSSDVLSVTGSIGGYGGHRGESESAGNITINGGYVKSNQATKLTAGIGGGNGGSSGVITINGGIIYAWVGGQGAGIGSGSDGRVNNITINGGDITIRCGSGGPAGIGGGIGSSGGTITINGGTINSTASCGGTGIGRVDTINITGGTVTATGGYGGAGIGGNDRAGSGNINISGGNVTATGGSGQLSDTEIYCGGAGIGGGHYGGGNNISISGGTVNAEAGFGAAGIGGGDGAGSGNITITGGTVIAKGGGRDNDYGGAGIGGGCNGQGGNITITGGNVTATGGTGRSNYGGAGIGGGYNGRGGAITIDGLATVVTATGGRLSAGIGGGYLKSSGTIIINGGTVNATGGAYGAGIGSGKYAGLSYDTTGSIRINGGSVTAKGGGIAGAGLGDGLSGAGIGGGEMHNGGVITISGGDIKATGGYGGAGIGCGRKEGIFGPNITISGGNVTAIGGCGQVPPMSSDYSGAGIGGGHESGLGRIIISGGSITAVGGNKSAGIGGGQGGEGSTVTVTGNPTIIATGTKNESEHIGYGSGSSTNPGTLKDTNSNDLSYLRFNVMVGAGNISGATVTLDNHDYITDTNGLTGCVVQKGTDAVLYTAKAAGYRTHIGSIIPSEKIVEVPADMNSGCAVTYDGNGSTGGSVPTDNNNYEANVPVNILGNTGGLVKTGFGFTGWNTAADGSGDAYNADSTFAMGTANITLYAQWAPVYTVTYDGNGSTGGSVPTDSNQYYQNDTVTVIGNTGSLVKTGFGFTGWNTAADGSGDAYNADSTFAMGTANITLYAQWAPVYTVTYDGNGSTGGSVPMDSNQYYQNNSVTVIGNTGSLVKTGFGFTGWNTAADGSGDAYNADSTFAMGTANITLYAQWAPVYTVTYDGNGNTGGSVPTDSNQYYQNNPVTVIGNTGSLVKTGFGFTGWNTAADGSGDAYNAGDNLTMGTANVTLYAQWAPVYTVTYDGNGNTGGSVPTDSNQYYQNDTVTVIGNTGSLVKSGYSFAGWNTQADGSGTAYSAGNILTMGTANVTLYARWTIITNSNTGGSSSSSPVNSTTSEVKVSPSQGSTVNLNSEASVTIPPGALQGSADTNVVITRLSTPAAVPSGFTLLGQTYEFQVGEAKSYTFSKPVTITLEFDPARVPAGTVPAIGYYDTNSSKWVILGGTVSGNKVTITVDHFTQFAVLAKNEAAGNSEASQETPSPSRVKKIFSDTYKNWARTNIEKLAEMGIVSGYPDGSFRPDGKITRAEIVTILVKALNLKTNGNKAPFQDTAGHWAQDGIAIAAAEGIISGYGDGCMRPDNLITREELAVMVVNAAKLQEASGDTSFTDNALISSWAKGSVLAAMKANMLKGYPDNTFRPREHATRAEAVSVIVTIMQERDKRTDTVSQS